MPVASLKTNGECFIVEKNLDGNYKITMKWKRRFAISIYGKPIAIHSRSYWYRTSRCLSRLPQTMQKENDWNIWWLLHIIWRHAEQVNTEFTTWIKEPWRLWIVQSKYPPSNLNIAILLRFSRRCTYNQLDVTRTCTVQLWLGLILKWFWRWGWRSLPRRRPKSANRVSLKGLGTYLLEENCENSKLAYGSSNKVNAEMLSEKVVLRKLFRLVTSHDDITVTSHDNVTVTSPKIRKSLIFLQIMIKIYILCQNLHLCTSSSYS